MGRSKYICGLCGRTSNLPDFCCGRVMVQKGSYFCRSCGTSTGVAGDCCGQPREQV